MWTRFQLIPSQPLGWYADKVSYNQVKDDGIGGACSAHGEDEAYTALVGKRPLAKPSRGCEDTIKINLREI
jgi:hypothetical protein